MLLDLLLDGSLLLLLSATGALIARTLLRDADWRRPVMLSFPLGAGVFSLTLFLISWSGVPIRPISIYGVLLLLLTATFLMARRMSKTQPERQRVPCDTSSQAIISRTLPYMISVGFVILSMALSVGRAYSTWDAAAIWSVKGYGLAREGTIFAGETWGAHGLSYPLNIPLLIAAFDVLGGDLLPGSKLIFPLFYGSILLGCIGLWRKFGVPDRIVTLGTLLVASTPLIFEHSTRGYANLPFSAYLLLACGLTIEAIVEDDSRLLTMGGLLFGLAAWTRPEGTLLVPLLMLTLILTSWISQRRMHHLIHWLLPAGLIISVWILFSSQHASSGQFSAGIQLSIQALIQGEFPWQVLPKILRAFVKHALTLDGWGMLFSTSFLALLFNVRNSHPINNPVGFSLLGVTAAAFAAMMLFFVIVPFVGNLDMWIETGMDRMFMPVGLLTAAWAVLAWGDQVSGFRIQVAGEHGTENDPALP